jgi:hypothetical protein
MRKLTLTGFLLLLPQSLTLVRLVATLTISIGHGLVLAIAQPFREGDHSTLLLANIASTSLCGVLLSALLIKLFDAIDSTLAQQLFGLHDTLPLVVVIVALETGFLVAAALVLWRRIASDRALRVARRLRFVQTGEMVCIPSCKPLTYHLFLSHVRTPGSKRGCVVFAALFLSTALAHPPTRSLQRQAWTTSDATLGVGAQDQMRIVKHRLSEMLPGCRIFLECVPATS